MTDLKSLLIVLGIISLIVVVYKYKQGTFKGSYIPAMIEVALIIVIVLTYLYEDNIISSNLMTILTIVVVIIAIITGRWLWKNQSD